MDKHKICVHAQRTIFAVTLRKRNTENIRMREKYQVVVHKFVVSTHLATEKKKKTSEFHAPRRLEPGSEVENDVGTCGNELLTLRTPQATTGRIQFPEAGQSRPSGNLVERVCL